MLVALAIALAAAGPCDALAKALQDDRYSWHLAARTTTIRRSAARRSRPGRRRK